MDSYISPLVIDYLTRAHVFTKKQYVSEDDIIRSVTSSISIVSLKENFAIPSQNKKIYTELLNKFSGVVMIVLDDLVNANYLLRQTKPCGKFQLKSYSLNFESDFIKKVIKSDDIAYKYVSHPAYSLKRGLPNNEDDLCKSVQSITLEDEEDEDEEEEEIIQPKKKVCKKEENKILELLISLSNKKEENVKENVKENVNEDNKILEIMTIQSDSDVNKYYNLYIFKNGTKHCTCPHFQFVCKKQNILCKHLECFLNSFPNYILDKKVFSGKSVILTHDNLKKYSKYSQKIDTIKDMEYIIPSSTVYHGRYIWAFEDNEENTTIQNTTTNNEVDFVMGTYDGLSDDD